MVKVRIQIKSEELGKTKATGSVSPFNVFKEIVAKGGVSSLYRG